MNPEDAVKAFADLGTPRAIGMHFGTFQLTDEAIEAPLHALEAARRKVAPAADSFTTLGFGETRLFDLRK
jgi:L-ascorbate metabolism protein UlaG (beta-lactamase superfamily)